MALTSVVAIGCGSLPPEQEPDAGRADGPPPGTTTYRGTLSSAPTVMFGGDGGEGMNFCQYTITLSQIDVSLDIATTGQVKGGSSLALATEVVLPTPGLSCTQPVIPPNILKFTFTSASPISGGSGGYTVQMTGDLANAPASALTLTVVPSAGAFSAAAKWSRLDAYPILTWIVNANLTLTVKP